MTNIKSNEFISVNISASVLYDDDSTGLSVKYFKNLISPEKFSLFEKDEQFIDFDSMLNYIEKYTDYTLFQIVPYTNREYHRIKLIFVHK